MSPERAREIAQDCAPDPSGLQYEPLSRLYFGYAADLLQLIRSAEVWEAFSESVAIKIPRDVWEALQDD